ncbi:hypothetical protein MKW98_000131 [Papaver atlanticum]|uniref:COBRA-like protein n=1 Tax=Papaver atlanticum TaxID=357466 RepID=A0AAD4XKD6_9MAGN|nr:hypothetical protein MKW98_000131 [Papaver atlanticum]
MGYSSVFRYIFLCSSLLFHLHIYKADGFDQLDPHGMIEIKWDILTWEDDTYNAQISILNKQAFRHIEKPGWRLGWTWQNDEVIWHIVGAEATEQGDCRRIPGKPPHTCEKQPEIIDLLPGVPYNMQTSNCCKGGVLTTEIQDPSKHGAFFQMSVGKALFMEIVNGTAKPSVNQTAPAAPPPADDGDKDQQPPSKDKHDTGKGKEKRDQDTWKLTCTYSQMQASQTPTCCVSMSSFYNDTIVQCPTCSCACRRDPTKQCIDPTKDLQPLIELPHSEDEVVPPKVRCTEHMCPIRIHWHVKTSYKDYWRVQVTVHNFNFVKNYSDWSLVVQHPNLKSLVQVFSFNYKPLLVFPTNDTGMFWGIPFYNNMLMQSSVDAGNVQTEILLKKDPGFTFGGGFAFPVKISFNGDLCVMPPPDQYPRLPNSSFSLSSNSRPILFSMFLLLLSLYIVY